MRDKTLNAIGFLVAVPCALLFPAAAFFVVLLVKDAMVENAVDNVRSQPPPITMDVLQHIERFKTKPAPSVAPAGAYVGEGKYAGIAYTITYDFGPGQVLTKTARFLTTSFLGHHQLTGSAHYTFIGSVIAFSNINGDRVLFSDIGEAFSMPNPHTLLHHQQDSVMTLRHTSTLKTIENSSNIDGLDRNHHRIKDDKVVNTDIDHSDSDQHMDSHYENLLAEVPHQPIEIIRFTHPSLAKTLDHVQLWYGGGLSAAQIQTIVSGEEEDIGLDYRLAMGTMDKDEVCLPRVHQFELENNRLMDGQEMDLFIKNKCADVLARFAGALPAHKRIHSD